MVSIHDVETNRLIEKAAEELKKIKTMETPLWARFVKTGVGQERAPDSKDWWYVRAASLLRKIYKMGPVGVNKLTKYYNKRKNRGFKPEKVYNGSGKIARVVLQQLELSGFVEKKNIKGKKGRIITGKGKKFLDQIAKLSK
ncbi:30S ribosomal protein S19e [Candidatus Woesearchaeota archaeon]|nr:30S ribosomal protein S19e [Candidatus Woesearchaeota archaeon]